MDINEFFGLPSPADKEAADYAEGAQIGSLAAATVHARLIEEYGDRSRAFREGMLEGVRDAL